jgi:hypothetical protein
MPTGRSAHTTARAGTCLVAILWCACLGAQEPVRIGTITIRPFDVFSPEEETGGWIYRAANALHSTTREGVLRAWLLFREGDVYEPEMLAETERNLRASGLVRSASVRAGPVHDGVVDVEVVTQDAWSLQIGVALGRDGGEMRQGFKLGEKNILGSGRRLAIAYGQDSDRSYRSVEVLDPQFLIPFGRAHLIWGSNSDGDERLLELGRPFYSVGARWSALARYFDGSRNESIYREGAEISRYQLEGRQIRANFAGAPRASPRGAFRIGAGFDLREERFAPLPGWEAGPIPSDRLYRDLFVQLETVGPDFVTWNYVNQDLRYEDFDLGRSLLLTAGVSPKAFGAPVTSYLAALRWQEGFRFGANAFLIATVEGGARFETTPRNALVSAEVLLVRRFTTSYPQTLVARLQAARGWNLDADRLLEADGATGLRAYPLHAFQGDRRILANVEYRAFCGCELLQLVAPGAAVFVDAGTAVPPGEPLRWSSIKVDAGVGLRFAIARTSSIFRVDVGYAFQPDPRGRRGWLVSFSGGQAF